MTDSLKLGDLAAAAVAVAPRVTLDDLNAKIDREQYHVFDDVLTICVLTTTTGFTVTGESACASPENFDQELGAKFARENAVRKLWGFEGYLLRERLHSGANIHGIGPCEARGRNPLYRGPGMDFGQAVTAMKEGRRVARAGWNGKGMFAYLVPAASYPAQTGAAKDHFGADAMVPYRPYFALKTVDEDVATWAPSPSDVIAEDWEPVD